MKIVLAAGVLLAAFIISTQLHAATAQTPCGGFLQPACPPPPPPVPPPPTGPVAATLTLTPVAPSRRVDSDNNLRLRGAVTGVGDPQGLTVELRRAVAGYGREGALEPLATQVNPDGSFEFALLPHITLDVQAVLRDNQHATGKSPPRRITVRSIQNLSISAVNARRGRFVLTSVGPAKVPLATGDVRPWFGKARFGYLYLIAKSRRFAMRIGFGSVRTGACAKFCRRSAIGYFRITPAIVRERRKYLACARTSLFLAVEDAAVSKQCGKPQIALRGSEPAT